LDSGHRVPRHPLFFLNYKSSQVLAEICNVSLFQPYSLFVLQVDGIDQEESAGHSAFEDVQKEESRMYDLILGPRDNYEAVMIKKINKVIVTY
jgi:hypothetical protein